MARIDLGEGGVATLMGAAERLGARVAAEVAVQLSDMPEAIMR